MLLRRFPQAFFASPKADGSQPGRDQHADASGVRVGDVHAGVVVAEDLAVGLTVLGKAERAVLAHADAVPEAAALDLPPRALRLSRHGQRGGGHESECEV